MKVSFAIAHGIAAGTIQKPDFMHYSEDDSTILGWEGSPRPTDEVLQAAWTAFGGDAAITDAANKQARKERFAAEADPLFFQVQRGEVEQSVYDAKITEIRADLPLSTD